MKPSSKNLEKKVKQIEKKLDNIEKTVEEKFTKLWEEETKGMSETSKRLLKEKISHNEKYAAHVFGVFDRAAAKALKEKLIKGIMTGSSLTQKDKKALEALSIKKLREIFLFKMAKFVIPKAVEQGLEEKVRSIIQAEPPGR